MNENEHNDEELNKTPPTSESGADDWHRDICQGIVMAYFLVMAVVYPLYAPGGYMRIGEVKYVFFRNVSLVTLAVSACVTLLAALMRHDKEWIFRNYRRMSVTDWFAYGYFVAVMLSYLCSAYKEDALWGAEGWYMGVATQMILVLVYFLISRYFHCRVKWIGVWLLAAAVVFLLGICNRYSVYPIAMEGQMETFISTLGNINWFCGYWSVTAPIGIMLYWCSDSGWVRLLSGVYSIIAMLAGMTQGSSSAYLVFIAVYLALLILSFRSNRRMYRFLELCMMFTVSCQLGRVMRYLPGLTYNYDAFDGGSGVTELLFDSNVTVWAFLLIAVCYAIFRLLDRKGHFHIERHRWLWVVMTAVVVLVFCIATVCLLMEGEVLCYREVPGTMERDSSWELVFDEDWGNGRGATWNCGIEAYRSMGALRKIVGVGPDCFADYVYDVPELAEKLADQFVNLRLTNAHSEQITLLVNLGVLGWLCYMGFFVTAFVRYMKRAEECLLLYVCAVSILAYTAHNLVSFQQVLNAPYVFIVLGIGESFYRYTVDNMKRGTANE